MAFLPTAQIRILILGGAYNVFHKQSRPKHRLRLAQTPPPASPPTFVNQCIPHGATACGPQHLVPQSSRRLRSHQPRCAKQRNSAEPPPRYAETSPPRGSANSGEPTSRARDNKPRSRHHWPANAPTPRRPGLVTRQHSAGRCVKDAPQVRWRSP